MAIQLDNTFGVDMQMQARFDIARYVARADKH